MWISLHVLNVLNSRACRRASIPKPLFGRRNPEEAGEWLKVAWLVSSSFCKPLDLRLRCIIYVGTEHTERHSPHHAAPKYPQDTLLE